MMTDTIILVGDRPTVVHSDSHSVPRFGMYAGPNYAGGQTWAAGAVPEAAAWDVQPINFLDHVTRNHDINYTYIEQVYKGDSPEMTAMRNTALWQADKEMLINVLSYQPSTRMETMYRDALIKGFAAKAVKDYEIDIEAEWRTFAHIDPAYSSPYVASTPGLILGVLGLVNSASTFSVTGMEALSSSGLSAQAAMLFNLHLEDNRVIQAENLTPPEGMPYNPNDYSYRVVQPMLQGDRFVSDVVVDGRRVVSEFVVVNATFTRKIYDGDVLVEQRNYTTAHALAHDDYGQWNYNVETTMFNPDSSVKSVNNGVLLYNSPAVVTSSHFEEVESLVRQGTAADYSTRDPLLDDNYWLNGNDPDLAQGLANTGSSLPSLPASAAAAERIHFVSAYEVVLNGEADLSAVVEAAATRGNAISTDDLRLINAELSYGSENNLTAGTRIYVPQKINGNLVVDYGNVRLSLNPTDGTYQYLINDPQANTTTLITRSLDAGQTSGYSDRYVKTDNASGLELESFINGADSSYGYQFDNGQATTSSFTLSINSTQTTTQTPTPDTVTPSAATGIADSGGTWTVSDLVAALNEDTTPFGALKSDSLTGGRRTGANSISGTGNTWDLGADAFKTVDQIVQDVINGTAPSWANLDLAAAAAGNSHATEYVPADPLVLDLNGDGVKLTSYAEKTVLFDIDHDGGSKEQTGWVSAEDGIVVMDLNGNGQIDDISETMSEYFNGAVGTNGDAGTKPYANGFEALRSLNSNNTGTSEDAFDNQDTAFANVKVWVDANSDGVTDAGELKTLTELNITSINLTPTAQSGLVNGGNEILATGTFTQNGLTKEAQAANFIANPYGQTLSAQGTGTRIDSQTDSGTKSAYVSHVTTGEVMDAAALNVANITGNAGNDTLTGDASANWLAGGQGSDTFNAGAGDDVLLIDAEDLQANIHGGDGNDIAQVIGDAGVTLNLAQAEIEAAIGGRGNDIFIGGGRSSVFIRAGDGDDIVIGGAANDALSGENGADLIDGGAGNDIIRGGRGQDQLMGGIGDDLVFGGQDDDRLSGGAGNDVLRGEQGDDVIDGGDGIDIAEFSGSFSDYRITKLTDTSYRVVDTKAGRDGADMLTNIEKLNFADVSAVDITLDNPLPVKDVLTIADRNGLKLIKVSDLLANDRDWQGDALHITTISDVKGGTLVGTWNSTTQEWTPTLTANGELQFTPDPAYTGVMSFKYKLADADGTPGATAFIAGTQIAAEMRGQVFIKTPDMPTDGLFTDQWYLSDINVLPVWKDAYGQGYTGKGVKIAQFEPGMPSKAASSNSWARKKNAPSSSTARSFPPSARWPKSRRPSSRPWPKCAGTAWCPSTCISSTTARASATARKSGSGRADFR